MYYTYVLVSLKDNFYYIGSTSDLEKRLDYHNTGKSKYTKLKMPWNLVYFEEFSTLSLSRKRETQIKCWKSRESIERLIKQGSIV